MRQRDFDNCSGHIPVSLPSFPLYFCKHEVFFSSPMDNIQKRWTPYTNAILELGAKKLDFIFRERILVVLTYCPSGIFVHCPQYLRVNKTRLEYALRSLHEQDGDRERFFLAPFGLAGDSSPCFRKTGHRPFSKGICQMKDIKKACRAHSLAFTFWDISRKSERSDA